MQSRFAKNTLFSTVAGLSTALSGFLSSVIVARLLGVEGTGAVSFALWIVMLTSALVDIGSSPTLSRYLPELVSCGEPALAERLAAYMLRPFLVVTFVAGSAYAAYAAYAAWGWNGFVGAVQPGWWDGATFWILCGVGCCLQAVGAFVLGYLRGMQRFQEAAMLTVAAFAVQLIGVTAGCLAWGVLGALGGYCAGSAVPAAHALLRLRLRGTVPAELKARAVRYAAYAWAGGLASAFVWSRLEIFFLNRSWGMEEVGLFTVGLTLSNLAAQGPLLLTGGMLAYFSECFGRSDDARIRAAYATGTRVLALLTFPACLGLAAIVPAVLPLIYGPAFEGAVPGAIVMVGATSIGTVAAVGSHLVYGLDRSDFIFFSALVGALLSIAAGLILIPAFGVLGAAWGRAAIQLFIVGLGVWFIMRRLHCPTPLKDLALLLLAAMICALAARIVLLWVPGPSAVLAAIAAGVVTYAAAVRLLRPLPAADVDRLQSLCSRLPISLAGPSARAVTMVSGR